MHLNLKFYDRCCKNNTENSKNKYTCTFKEIWKS